MGSIQHKTHVALPRYTANSEHTIGAMEEMSGKVQNASTHPLGRKNHEHVHTAVGQFKGQFKGAMERYTGSIWRENSLWSATTHHEQ